MPFRRRCRGGSVSSMAGLTLWLAPVVAPCEVHQIYFFSLDVVIQSGCYNKDQLRIAVQAGFAIFFPLGCVRRRQMRSSSLLLPRFGGEDVLVLDSVTHHQNLQLNLQPHVPHPTRLLVEPLDLRLVRPFDAPEVAGSCP